MRFFGDRTLVRSTVLAVVISLPLVGLGSPTVAAPLEPRVAAAAVKVSERPDSISAMLTARAQGERVEDLSARTEFSSTWANPDGSWTQEGHTGAQRFRGADGEWVPVNLDLVPAAGGVQPVGHPLGLRLPGKGASGAISVAEPGGRTVSLQWTGQLPAPVLEGNRATYVDVQPGVDMVVDALRNGYEQFFVVHERPTGAISWDLPLLTKGLTARAEQDGSISFVDAKGKVASTIPAAVAWDARTDELTGDPVSTTAVELSVAQKNPGRAIMTITPDAEWLADPETVFPVTVDPTYASATRYTTFDTFVQQGYTSGQSTSTELKLGNNGSGQIARSFLEFQLGSLKGKKIMSAQLKLRATHSWSCNTRYWQAWKVGSDVDANTVWSNQPSWTEQYASSNQTKGYSSSCPNGEVSIGIKSMVQMWADNSLTTNRLGLRAANESDEYAWKKFASSETANDPYISITYNRAPATPGVPTLAPAATYNSALYTSDTTPALTSKATDADGNQVQLNFEVHNSTTVSGTSLKAACTTDYVASGANATCSPSTAVADSGTYHVRVRANDYLQDGAWSSWTTFKVAAATPAAPVIDCPAYADGSWTEATPATPVACRITATGVGTNAPGYIRYAIDGGDVQRVQISQSNDPAVAGVDVTVPNTEGGHRLVARAESPSGLVSDQTRYGFGFGSVGIQTPAASPMLVTTGNVEISAIAPPTTGSAPLAELRWRLASSGDDEATGWNTATELDVEEDPSTGGLTVTGGWDTMLASRDEAAEIDLDSRVPATLELQVCVTYPSGLQCTWDGQEVRILRVPHAFGNGFPVADAGPGQVALWTGEFTTSATDVSVPGYVGDLSISRTHSTFAGAPSAASKVFGPGWTASFDGPESGLAGFELIDNTLRDGTLVLLSPEGIPMVFAPGSGWTRRTGANLAGGTWVAVDDETIDLGVTATVNGTGPSTTFALTTPDNVTTTFKATTASGEATAAVFAPDGVSEPGIATATSYATDGAGRVTRILAPIPTGMTSSDCPVTGALQPGCRALDVSYATSTTASSTTPGDFAGQVKQIDLKIYNPDKAGGAGMDTITVAVYQYDADGRLVEVTDPRVNLSRSYTYDAEDRLTGLTDPGLTPYQLEYAGTPAKLSRVKRDRPTTAGGGTATLATVLYGVPTSGSGLPDLSATGVAAWGQESAPTYAAAVFDDDKPISTLDPAQVSAGDWSYASIFATDERGYTTNTAAHGAGTWLPTWTEYNNDGYVIRELDAGDIAAVRAGEAVASQAGSLYVYNTASNGPAETPAGSMVTDSYGTPRWVVLDNGDQVLARPHTEYVYDEGSPNGGINPDTGHGWGYVTSTKSNPAVPDTLTSLEAPTVSKTGYGPTEADWTLGFPAPALR